MTTILHKRGAGQPSPDELKVGEIAIDTLTGTLYTKQSDGSVVEIGGGPEGGDVNCNIPILDSPPANPELGQQWFSSTDGYLYIWYGSEWVAIGGAGGGDGGGSGGGDGGNGGGPNGPGDNVDFSLVRLLVNGEDAPAGDKNYSTWDKSGNATEISFSAPNDANKGNVNTDHFKYGGGSIVNGPPGSNGSSPQGWFLMGEHAVGGDSWAFEFWARHVFPLHDTMQFICGKWTNGSTTGRAWNLNYTRASNSIELMHSPAGSSFARLSATISISNQTWHHYAVVYDATQKTFTFFFDGSKTIEITNCDPIDPITGSGREWNLGAVTNVTDTKQHFGACFDDIRLTVGTPVYTDDFTPPGELATSARSFSNDFVSRPWTDDSNDLEDSNDADLS